LITLLSDLPQETYVELGDGARKTGEQIAASLRALVSVDPELNEEATTDIPGLFRSPTGKPRLSVVNLQGIDLAEDRQIFVQKLLMNIFSWVTHSPPGKLSTLLVIDEAIDFVPSQGSPPTKDAIRKIANQGRKFGLGLILASQNVKGLDNKVLSNCRNQFMGLQSSSTDIESCKKMGIHGVGKLRTGEFIGKSDSFKEFPSNQVKFNSALCLSWHPNPAPGYDEVVRLAKESKRLLIP
jgi:hypothetical protein